MYSVNKIKTHDRVKKQAVHNYKYGTVQLQLHFYRRGDAWRHEKSLNIPVACLRGPRFLVAWNIHVSCTTRGCCTRGYYTRGHYTRGYYTRGWLLHEWLAINILLF